MIKRRNAMPYVAALRWLLQHDSTGWVHEPTPVPTMPARLLGEIYNRSTSEVVADLRRMLAQEKPPLRLVVVNKSEEKSVG